ncbi:MAG: hypothetical protein L0K07_06670 [Yaniella sp.]|nr:hypothetical protein [Yaniella sp.]
MTERTDQDSTFRSQAIDWVIDAPNSGWHPFAFINGTVIAYAGNNSNPPEGDPTRRTELWAAVESTGEISAEGLSVAIHYMAAEPCPIRWGATCLAGAGRIVYTLPERRLLDLTCDDPENPTFGLVRDEGISRGS